MSDQNHDVIIIGAGPAGSTTAAFLAGKGHRVLVLEKDKFPRYHVGESMMPFCYYTLEKLGIAHKMNEIGFQQKHSVQFVTTDGRISKPFYFFQHKECESSVTWQVERAVFDEVLADKARENGAEIRESHKVREIVRDEDGTVIGVEIENETGRETLFAKIVIDASGRDAVVSSKSKWRRRDPLLNKIAIWTYYEGAMRDPGLDAGATTVAYIPEKGWFWYIPMRNNRVSVGIVADRDYLYRETNDPAAIFEREIKENVWIQEHLEPGKQTGEFFVTGEYSYRAEYCAADGVLLVGDAFAFLDPVFSSGVFLALKSGELAADYVNKALKSGDTSVDQFDEYGVMVCEAIERMRKIVYAFYDDNFSFAKLIKRHPHLREPLTDLLIGDLFNDQFDELFAAIEEICELPDPVDYGFRTLKPAVPQEAT
ncbi:MAG: NAD(P)/FAD-dependent oxidoreductase [Verrucomicrobiales bacterium]|nr:NAD(P)/FAD-dependent oxidoreductase [Verrucomicrobiales bacterium]